MCREPSLFVNSPRGAFLPTQMSRSSSRGDYSRDDYLAKRFLSPCSLQRTPYVPRSTRMQAHRLAHVARGTTVTSIATIRSGKAIPRGHETPLIDRRKRTASVALSLCDHFRVPDLIGTGRSSLLTAMSGAAAPREPPTDKQDDLARAPPPLNCRDPDRARPVTRAWR